MGILDSILHLFTRGNDPKSPVKHVFNGNEGRAANQTNDAPSQRDVRQESCPAEAETPVAQRKRMHWPPTGQFPVDTVGESFYRGQIQQLVRNASGERALLFSKATLVPDNNNEHDPQAVAIWIGDTKVAHLSREDARTFRQSLLNSGLGEAATTCDAVIHGGGSYQGRVYDYSIELDFRLGENLIKSQNVTPTYPNPVRASTEPALLDRSETEFFIKIPFVDRETLRRCHIGCTISIWTKHERPDIHFYAPGSIGGSGRIAAFPKRLIPGLMEKLKNFPYLTAYKVEGRSLVIRGGRERDSRFAFLDKGSASVVILNIETTAAGVGIQPVSVAALAFEVELSSGKMVRQIESFSGSVQSESHIGLDTDTLTRIVSSADVLIAHNARLHQKMLATILPGSLAHEKIWECAMLMWGASYPSNSLGAICETVGVTRAEPHNCLSDCMALSEVLFTHSGKTKRSRTYMGHLLPNPSQ